jgi:hypothetical protein
MPNWKKVIVSGSDAALNSLNVTNLLSVTGSSNLTGSLNISGSARVLGNTGTTTFYTNADTLIFTGSVFISGSIIQTGSLNVTSITSSLFGTASWAQNSITSSYAISALSASYALTASYALNGGGGGGGGAFTYHQTASAVTWSVTHNLSTYTPLVQVYDNSYNLITPSNISGSGLNTTQITFAYATTGYAVISTGGSVSISIEGSNATLIQAIPATTWSFYHGLNETYPVFTIFDNNDDVIVPLKIHADNANTASIYFSTARTGTAVAANCGLSGSTFESASWAATASYFVGTVTSASYATTSSYALTSNTSTLQQVVNTGNGISNYGGNGSASIQSTNFTNNRTLYLNDNSFPTIRLVDNLNASNNLQIDIATLSLNGTSYNWSDIVNSTSSYALTASYVNPLRQTVEITGSFNVTGSTTQIGNNNLIGNTSLSGSLTISGSQGSNTPTINIFGDIEQTGYTRFLPVNTNINTSISASYIYVSGSTQDLYFSQNSKGYNNVTRLRWLEGNLYTGLLNGGLITTSSSTVYNINSGSGIIVDLNASLNDNPYPTIQYLNWGNLSGSISAFTSSYQQVFVGIDSTSNIFAQGTPFSNGQFDTVINVGMVFFQNGSTINGVKTQPSVAYGFEQSQNIFNRAFGPLKLSGYTLAPSGSSTGSLIVASGTAYAPGSNYTVNPNEPSYTVDNGTTTSKIFRYRQSGSTWVYDTNAGAGYASINPTQYSNNGVLTSVPGGGSNRQWSIQRVFWFPNSVVKAIVVYYGNATYPTEVEAIANISFESFVEAPNTAANAIYLGAIVVRNDANFTNTATFKIQPGGLFRQVGGSGGGGSVITQTLSGLSDVAISGPTDHQPFAYDTTAGKWTNQSAISASLHGNADTATTASYALTATSASYALTSSYLNPVTNGYVILTQVSQSLNYADDTAAAAGGVPLGGLYRNGNFIAIRIV